MARSAERGIGEAYGILGQKCINGIHNIYIFESFLVDGFAYGLQGFLVLLKRVGGLSSSGISDCSLITSARALLQLRLAAFLRVASQLLGLSS